mgnify:CR=1 FL=1
MKIYTKTGDDGTTALFGGTRVPKHHIRIESYGTLDELNSWIGLIRDQPMETSSKEVLIKIQEKLFTIGALLAIDPKKEKLKNGKDRLNIPKINNGKRNRPNGRAIATYDPFYIARRTYNSVILSYCKDHLP